ncbi:MAG: tRNA (adenosine(37)-N6)-threonylcarbamoyltransferase complex dimerization subunit type 1 TsaB, partial [Bacteroidetes bacterium]
MPNLLCIETATSVCSVAVFHENGLLAMQEIADGNQHASQLAVIIQQTLLTAGLTAKQLDAIVISKGPGSYTGLRVGVSTAKGICYALNKPLIAVNTLKSMAFAFIEQYKPQSGLICPMIDARRMEVYTALFDVKGNEVMQTQAKIIEPDGFAKFANQEVAFIGNGAQKCQGIINHTKATF